MIMILRRAETAPLTTPRQQAYSVNTKTKVTQNQSKPVTVLAINPLTRLRVRISACAQRSCASP